MPEPLQRRGDRRHGDRRDSLRRTLAFTVVADGGSAAVEGELGLGGASFTAAFPPRAREVELRFSLPGAPAMAVAAQVTARTVHGADTTVHLRFGELPLEVALAVARWLDDEAATSPP